MSGPRAIKATFSDWRTVKGRKALQLVFEVPLEQQAEVLTMLGAPMPDNPLWCGIALLGSAPDQPVGDRSSAAKERYAAMSPAEQARVRAGRLPGDERFRAWVAHQRRWDALEVASEQDAIEHIREKCCYGRSRTLIAEDPDCYDRFIALETAFKIDVGELAEPR